MRQYRYFILTYTVPADTAAGTLFQDDNLKMDKDGFTRCDGVAFPSKDSPSFEVALSGSKDGPIIDESPMDLYAPEFTPVNERFLALDTDVRVQQYNLRIRTTETITEETKVKVIFRLTK